MNGSAVPPKPVADQIRDNIRAFNLYIDGKASEPGANEAWIRLMRAIVPPMIRWRFDETQRDTTWEARRDAFVVALGWLFGNELYRPGMGFWERIAFNCEAVAEVMARGSMAMTQRADAEARAEAAMTPATPPQGNA